MKPLVRPPPRFGNGVSNVAAKSRKVPNNRGSGRLGQRMDTRMAIRILCPACRRAVLTPLLEGEQESRCCDCAARYPVVESIIDLLPRLRERQTVAQALMEWGPIVRVLDNLAEC
jgi:uncharacterized protein YbaR (Trm112 family)